MWLAQIGPYGAWGDLQIITRWGQGACGMFEAQWSMPLPPDFEHPLLRRGTLVELMDGPWRIGSPLILSEPAKGTGLDAPWQFVATGIGREVEGDSSFYAFDAFGDVTTRCGTAVDVAIVRGLRWGGRDASVPTTTFGSLGGEPQTVGSLLSAYGDSVALRWGVGQDNLVRFAADPTTPTYQVTPDVVTLGTADDDYATVVYVRYPDSTSGTNLTVHAPASASLTEQRFGHRETLVDLTDRLAMSAAAAQAIADGILAKSKGRLAWTNGLTVTSNEILTMGGVPADMSKVLEDVGNGCMVRLNGISSDLLEYNGQTYLDIIIGEARYTDGAQTIDLNPLGLAPRDLAAVVESVTGMASAA